MESGRMQGRPAQRRTWDRSGPADRQVSHPKIDRRHELNRPSQQRTARLGVRSPCGPFASNR